MVPFARNAVPRFVESPCQKGAQCPLLERFEADPCEPLLVGPSPLAKGPRLPAYAEGASIYKRLEAVKGASRRQLGRLIPSCRPLEGRESYACKAVRIAP